MKQGAILYTRVSTDEQNNGYSPADQIKYFSWNKRGKKEGVWIGTHLKGYKNASKD